MTRRHFTSADPRRRSLRLEPLEPRLALTVFTVNSLADLPVDRTDSVVTLRDAIAAANNNVPAFPGGPAGDSLFSDTIRFQSGLTGTIQLTQGQLTLSSRLFIDGPGSNLITIKAQASNRAFNVSNSGVTVVFVSIDDVTITGNGGSTVSDGGGILNRENLTLRNVVVSGNAALRGGGVFNAAGVSLTVQNSHIDSNIAGSQSIISDGEGGGLFNEGTATLIDSTVNDNSGFSGIAGGISNSGTLTLRDSQVVSNLATHGRGGISNSGTLTILNSTIAGNQAFGSGGSPSVFGGIYNLASGTATVQNSTISGNTATAAGGGIANEGTMTLENTTVSGNLAGEQDGGVLNSGSLTLRNSTIVGNQTFMSGASGAGIRNTNPFGVLMYNTIVLNNLRGPIPGSGIVDNYSGGAAHASSAHNILGFGDTSGLANGGVNGNQINVNGEFVLGPLAANGGPRQTHLPLVGSPAIDAGRNAEIPVDAFDVDGDGVTTEPIPFDGRGVGFPRLSGVAVDIGAVEVQVAPLADFDFDADVDGGDFLIWQRNFGLTGLAANRAAGDADLDSDVDGADFGSWKSQFGSTPAIAAGDSAASAALTVDAPAAGSALAPGFVDAALAYYQRQTREAFWPRLRPRVPRR